MIPRRASLWTDCSGAAAAEMALMTPLLIAIMIGGLEGGHFLWQEHRVVIAARETARFAGRQPMEDFDCTAAPADSVAADTKDAIVELGQAKLGAAATISPVATCYSEPDMVKGIYLDAPNGATIVTVTATMPYPSLFSDLGFTTAGLTLVGSSEATVMGL